MLAESGADWTKFWELIKDIKFAMFTAHASDGHMHSRPMTTQNKSDDRANVLWFFMSRSSEPVLDIARDASVNVAYAERAALALEHDELRSSQTPSLVSGGCGAVIRDGGGVTHHLRCLPPPSA